MIFIIFLVILNPQMQLKPPIKKPLPFAEPLPNLEIDYKKQKLDIVPRFAEREVTKKVSKTPGSDNLRGFKGSGKGELGLKTVKGVNPLGLGQNAKGDVELGIGGGVGLGVSAKGDISLGVGIVSITVDPKNLNNSALGLGFNTMTIVGVQEGCTTTLYYKILGVTVNTETRIDSDCKKPEPITKPDPKTSDDINKNNKGNPNRNDYQSDNDDPITVPIPLIPGRIYGIMYETGPNLDGSAQADVDWVNGNGIYWFMPSGISLGNQDMIGARIQPIFNRLDKDTKLSFYETLGIGWTFAPWIRKGTPVYTVPSGQPNAGTKFIGDSATYYWLEGIGGSSFEPNYFIPNQLTRAYYVWRVADAPGEIAGWDLKIK